MNAISGPQEKRRETGGGEKGTYISPDSFGLSSILNVLGKNMNAPVGSYNDRN